MGKHPATEPADDTLLYGANVFVTGEIDVALQTAVVDRLRALRESGEDAVVEITTTGGDAEAARRIACELRLFRQRAGARIHVVGRTTVYSGGVTILAALPPEARFLTADTMLLVHERHENRTLTLNGPTTSCIQLVRSELAALEAGRKLEQEGFEDFVRGSAVGVQDLRDHARSNWYITAAQAADYGLIRRMIGCGDPPRKADPPPASPAPTDPTDGD